MPSWTPSLDRPPAGPLGRRPPGIFASILPKPEGPVARPNVPRSRRNVCHHRRMADRRRWASAAFLICLAACRGGTDDARPTTGTPASPPSLPRGLPTAYPSDLPAGDVPVDDLVPSGDEVTGTWYAHTSEGDAIVVAWQRPGPDPFRADRGTAVWLHRGDAG